MTTKALVALDERQFDLALRCTDGAQALLGTEHFDLFGALKSAGCIPDKDSSAPTTLVIIPMRAPHLAFMGNVYKETLLRRLASSASMARGDAFAGLGRFEAAVESFRAALDSSPPFVAGSDSGRASRTAKEHFVLHCRIGTALAATTRYRGAVEAFESALAIHGIPKDLIASADMLKRAAEGSLARLRQSGAKDKESRERKRAAKHAAQKVAPPIRMPCDGCGASGHKLLNCSACKATFYCSKECQKRHWKNGHKAECARRRQSSRRAKKKEKKFASDDKGRRAKAHKTVGDESKGKDTSDTIASNDVEQALAQARRFTAKRSHKRAVEEYRKVIALEPRNAVAHCNLGVSLGGTYPPDDN